ncbi:DNA (cytosine-5-)-methyltransferase [Cytobacillus depressus]|uniref:DNA (cytosine-5-)-methyltransferase n=1 Tax=Cytobacillus depressus TaxID=1602942 RepID=A0A6L3VA00_9BACI|nr:DNA cytosine methyltransferase [Cytobacillus depressus]KAB2337635.1 DNA (cytosine-5-)-methyltransferase [Cytobacillus depressus]
MKSIELFAGIGGIALAAEWAGIETIAFCEREPFCQKVLRKHWPSVPIFDDVCTLNKHVLEERGVDVGTIELISGGYPCQPFSSPGNRKGEEDDRHLWPEIKRLLQEIRPNWFVGENVAGHITLGLDTVLYDLESIGYTWQPFVIPAASVGANHERYRVFIVAHANGKSELQTNQKVSSIRKKRITRENTTGRNWREVPRAHWISHQPSVRRVDDGVSRELDKSRLIALGNAVVPQQIYPIFKYIKEIHDMETQE